MGMEIDEDAVANPESCMDTIQSNAASLLRDSSVLLISIILIFVNIHLLRTCKCA